MRGYTIYPKQPKRLFRDYRTASLTVPNSTAIFCDFLNNFLQDETKIRVGTKIVGRVGLPEPNNFFVLALNNKLSCIIQSNFDLHSGYGSRPIPVRSGPFLLLYAPQPNGRTIDVFISPR